MVTQNKGEWSELYVFLKLLGSGILYAADADLNKIENPEAFIEMALKFQQMMLLYEAGIQEIKTKLEILNRECRITCEHNPIESIKSRVKDPRSIAKKMKKNAT